MKRPRFLVVAAMMALLAANATAAAASPPEQPNYHIAKVVPLGDPDRWDYVYVAHGDRITVVNGDSGALIGTIAGMPGGTHGVAISHATGMGYTDDGKAGVVVEFDLNTLEAVKRIKAEVDADGIVFDPASGHVFVIDGDSGKLTVIDQIVSA